MFKLNSLGLALGMALKPYTSVAEGIKQKFRNFFELILTFAEITEEKLVRVASPPSLPN